MDALVLPVALILILLVEVAEMRRARRQLRQMQHEYRAAVDQVRWAADRVLAQCDVALDMLAQVERRARPRVGDEGDDA